MPRTKSVPSKQNMKRREFKNIDDISEFENQLFFDEASDDDLRNLDYSPDDREIIKVDTNQKEKYPKYVQEAIEKYDKYKMKNCYYEYKSDDLVYFQNIDEATEYINAGKIIPYKEYLQKEILKQNPMFSSSMAAASLEPIIFEKKGKTPPSVPYLNVYVTSDIKGDIKLLHPIHSKTRMVHNS